MSPERKAAERRFGWWGLAWFCWHWGLLVPLAYTPFAYRIPVGSALIAWDIVMGVHWFRLHRRYLEMK